ncbi:MAG: glycerophosphodiester phosphodiesterase, partial [Actinobacteria bacterium]|nr:glycerophosphodiester phosphodiesterase [Actinomycetota bacterium]
AHRGASGAKPENTVAAFEEAGRMGADMVELDVRRTADGALVVHHDAAVPDVGTIVELRKGDLPPSVPTLAEALEACAGMGVNIEIKNSPMDPDYDEGQAVAGAVAGLVLAKRLQNRVIVSSFNLAAVDAVRAASSKVPTALLTIPALDQQWAIDIAAEHGHAAWHPHHTSVTADLVDAAHAAGLKVNTWTVDDPDTMRALAAMGVDGIVTNHPDTALTTLR